MTLYTAARQWVRLARQEDQDVKSPAAKYRAAMYRRTAIALLYKRKTGISVCVCCFKPYGVHK
jgi:hypothetical protein